MQALARIGIARPSGSRWIAAALTTLLSACGGGYGGGGSGGMMCGGAYATCPPPAVAISAPAAGATVSGTVALTATASASSANRLMVTRVDFTIDGTAVGSAMSSPYTVNWNSTTVANGNHSLAAKVTDSGNGTAMASPMMINVQNTAAMSSSMTPQQLFPAPSSGAKGTARITVSLATGATSGTVQLHGVSATAVTLNEGFAGSEGPVLVALAPRGTADEWAVPGNTVLSPEQLTALTQGRLYVIARSAANPHGEVRGQLTPPNVLVSFSGLGATPEAAGMGIKAAGVAATTVDTSANTVSMHVNSSGVDDAMAAEAATAGGARLAELAKDSVNMGHWSVELADLSAQDLANLKAGRWQVSVATPVSPRGALRGAVSAQHVDARSAE